MPQKRNLIGIGIAVMLGVLVVRASLLYGNTRQLVEVSDQFPREYTIGSDSNLPLITYVALGDSTIQGAGCAKVQQTIPYMVAKSIADRGFRVKVINRAVVGATVADVESTQLDSLQNIHADLITLNVGSNDATHFTDYIDYDHRLTAVLTEITKFPDTEVIVASTPDLSLVPALQPGFSSVVSWRAREQNKILSNIVTGSSVKIANLFDNGKLAGVDNYASDQFHPSAQGYAKWAALYDPFLDSVKK